MEYTQFILNLGLDLIDFVPEAINLSFILLDIAFILLHHLLDILDLRYLITVLTFDAVRQFLLVFVHEFSQL
jgi:hypothetical protein